MHDYLGLCDQSFEACPLIVFNGVSGSGKSTYLHYLLDNHPDFATMASTRLDGSPLQWSDLRYPQELVVVDELVRWRDLVGVVRLLLAGHRVLAASHLPSRVVEWLTSAWQGRHYRIDIDPRKLQTYLHSRGVTFDPVVLTEFSRRFGANYTDLDIILEYTRDGDFTRAYRHFEKHCRLRLE